MEEGVITGYGLAMTEQQWGTKIKSFSVENKRDVKNFRCKECGYVEVYAK